MDISIDQSPRDSRGHRLTTALLVREPREEVFAFFADAFQLETLTPPWLNFSVLAPQALELGEGSLIDYKLRLYGVPLRWQSRITSWEPPHQFVDEQVRGPYRFWHHLHTFEEREGGTLIGDVVDYAVPLSWVMHPLLVRRDLMKIFAYRRETMRRIFTPVEHVAEGIA